MTDDNYDKALLAHEHIRKEKSDYLKAAMDASALTVRSLILVNGAAVVTLWAFLGAALQTSEVTLESTISAFAIPIFCFAFGVGTGVFTAVFSCGVTLMDHREACHTKLTWEPPYFENPVDLNKIEKERYRYFVGAITTGIFSLGSFFVGVFYVAYLSL